MEYKSYIDYRFLEILYSFYGRWFIFILGLWSKYGKNYMGEILKNMSYLIKDKNYEF